MLVHVEWRSPAEIPVEFCKQYQDILYRQWANSPDVLKRKIQVKIAYKTLLTKECTQSLVFYITKLLQNYKSFILKSGVGHYSWVYGTNVIVMKLYRDCYSIG